MTAQHQVPSSNRTRLAGTDDQVVHPDIARHHLARLSGARADWRVGAGHPLLLEDPARFGRTLLAFTTECTRGITVDEGRVCT